MINRLGRFILAGLAVLLIAGAAPALDNPEQRVSTVIKNYIVGKHPDWTQAEISLTFKQADKTFASLQAYGSAEIKLLPVLPDFKPVGNVIFPLIITDGENEEKFLVRTKVEVQREIAAANRQIKKGELLALADLKLESRDIALLPQKYFGDTVTLVGKESKIAIPANSTIFAWMVGPPALIKQGGAVTIVVSAPGLAIKAKGEALEPGYPDQLIRVKRLDSGKVIKAKVKSANEVEVEME